MANSGWHTNGSQWCITLGDRSYLDGDYTVFGHVIKGMEVVMAIVQSDEILNIKIVRVGIAANTFHPMTESFKLMVEAAKIKVEEAAAKRKIEEEQIIETNWPQARPLLRFVVVKEGEGPKPQNGTKSKVQYKGKFLRGEGFVSTANGGKPWFGEIPESFEYEIGKTSVNPGFDSGVSQMRKGEQRILIIPSELAYGVSGYYPPERKGERRFHVSPNEILVYEVEVLEIME